MSVEEFVSRVLNSNKTQIPPASTPYRQLKRHHSTQVQSFTGLVLLILNHDFKKYILLCSHSMKEAAG